MCFLYVVSHLKCGSPFIIKEKKVKHVYLLKYVYCIRELNEKSHTNINIMVSSIDTALLNIHMPYMYNIP